MDKKYLYTLLALFILLNALLLFEYKSLKDSSIDNLALIQYRANSYLANSIAIVNGQEVLTNYLDHIEYWFDSEEADNVFLFFTSNIDCSNCITETLEQLTGIDNNFQDNILILYENVSTRGVNFESFFNTIAPSFKKSELEFVDDFNTIGLDQFPILILYNREENYIIDAYQPEPGNELLLNAFVNRANSFLKSR